ncbi:MAG: hypothetical protein ACO21J_10110 [Anaerohalosphaeraceae bacterium]
MKRLFPLYSGLLAQVKLRIVYHISQEDAGEVFGGVGGIGLIDWGQRGRIGTSEWLNGRYQMKTETIISIYWYSMWYCVFSMWFIWICSRWFNKSAIILFARFVFLIACISTVFYTFGTIIDITFDIRTILVNDPDSSSVLTLPNGGYALLSIFFIWICYFKFWKSWWYYMTRSTKTIQAEWNVKKYHSLYNNDKDPKQAYEHLKKASELGPESIFVWCRMSWYNEFIFDNSELADEHFAKAKEALDNRKYPTDKDRGLLELTEGETLVHRNENKKGAEHLKNAYELDPHPYIKERYEKALEKISE